MIEFMSIILSIPFSYAVDSPSSSASDIDNLIQATADTVRDGHSAMDHRSHVVSAGNRPNFMRLLDFVCVLSEQILLALFAFPIPTFLKIIFRRSTGLFYLGEKN